VVAVFIDETAARFVHKDALNQARRWIEGRGNQRSVHVDPVATGGLAHQDPRAVIIRVALFHDALLSEVGAMLVEHVAIHREPARGQYYASSSSHPALFTEDCVANANNSPPCVSDEVSDIGIVLSLDA
jgi:hypothetical protein